MTLFMGFGQEDYSNFFLQKTIYTIHTFCTWVQHKNLESDQSQSIRLHIRKKTRQKYGAPIRTCHLGCTILLCFALSLLCQLLNASLMLSNFRDNPTKQTDLGHLMTLNFRDICTGHFTGYQRQYCNRSLK